MYICIYAYTNWSQLNPITITIKYWKSYWFAGQLHCLIHMKHSQLIWSHRLTLLAGFRTRHSVCTVAINIALTYIDGTKLNNVVFIWFVCCGTCKTQIIVIRSCARQNVFILLGQYYVSWNPDVSTETEMYSFWWNFHHCRGLHWKMSNWQLPVQLVRRIS